MAWITPEVTVSLATLLTAIISVFMSIRNAGKINDVHLSLNGRLTELLESNRKVAHQEGIDEEKGKVT